MRIERLVWCSRRCRCARLHGVLPMGSGCGCSGSAEKACDLARANRRTSDL
jgi:hypothetical protein